MITHTGCLGVWALTVGNTKIAGQRKTINLQYFIRRLILRVHHGPMMIGSMMIVLVMASRLTESKIVVKHH